MTARALLVTGRSTFSTLGSGVTPLALANGSDNISPDSGICNIPHWPGKSNGPALGPAARSLVYFYFFFLPCDWRDKIYSAIYTSVGSELRPESVAPSPPLRTTNTAIATIDSTMALRHCCYPKRLLFHLSPPEPPDANVKLFILHASSAGCSRSGWGDFGISSPASFQGNYH